MLTVNLDRVYTERGVMLHRSNVYRERVLSNDQIKFETIRIGDVAFRLRTLADRFQAPPFDSLAEPNGVPAAIWSYFGVVWPSGLVLADAMSQFPIQGKKILEVGSGIALASLVIHQRGGDVTVSDYHPLVESFLLKNIALNHLPPIPFQHSDWTQDNPRLGLFDVIIGSDILYERGQAHLLAHFIDDHTHDHAEVVIVDPGRGHHRKFSTEMVSRGYDYSEEKIRDRNPESSISRGRILTYGRDVKQKGQRSDDIPFSE